MNLQLVALDTDSLGEVYADEKFQPFGTVTSYGATQPDQVAERIGQADVILTNKVQLGAEQFDAAPQLKLICICATGMNNIDLDEASKRGIVVKNAEGYSTDSVAQWTLGMMLELTNHHRYFDRYAKSGDYAYSTSFTHYGRHYSLLKGKQLGIIGLGTIGQEVARLATAFGMKVAYHSASGRNMDQPYPHMDLQQLLSTSDVVTIHTPLTETTKGLVDAEALRWMQPHAILINVGRGGIVEERALVEALNHGHLAAAGVDVFVDEPLPAGNPFEWVGRPDQLLLSPHTAWAAVEAREHLLDIVAENIRSFITHQD